MIKKYSSIIKIQITGSETSPGPRASIKTNFHINSTMKIQCYKWKKMFLQSGSNHPSFTPDSVFTTWPFLSFIIVRRSQRSFVLVLSYPILPYPILSQSLLWMSVMVSNVSYVCSLILSPLGKVYSTVFCSGLFWRQFPHTDILLC